MQLLELAFALALLCAGLLLNTLVLLYILLRAWRLPRLHRRRQLPLMAFAKP